MRHLNKVCAIGLGLLAGQAFSAPCDDITIVVDTGTFTLDCVNNGTEAEVAVFFSNVNTAQVIVANGTALSLLNVRSEGTPVTVVVRGATPAENPTGLSGIQVPNLTTAPPVFFELNINGDLSAGIVGATGLVNSVITGNVSAPVTLITRAGFPGELRDVRVIGDWSSSIGIEESGLGVADGILRDLMVEGKMGLATTFIKVDGTIDGIEAGELNAAITDMAGGMDKVSIGSLRIVNTNGGTGDVNAAITCASGPTEFIVEGALKRLDDIIGFEIPLLITGSGLPDSLPGVEYQFSPSGLQGQIIFGAVAPFTKTWLGETSIGGANLTNTPSYSQSWTTFGGGSIGLAPFDIHDVDCKPPNGGNFGDNPLEPVVASFLIEHYGPVSFISGGNPVVVKRRPKGSIEDWGTIDPISSNCYTPVVGPRRCLRAVFDYRIPNGFEYRVTPVMSGASQLKSELGANDAPVVDYVYTFGVGIDCIEDINGDNSIDLADLSVMLFNFGLAPGCPIQGDLNVDGAVNLTDLSLLLFKFGTTCGAAAATAGGGGGATALIAEACGFNHSEAYLAWRASLSPAELANHLKEIPAILAGR